MMNTAVCMWEMSYLSVWLTTLAYKKIKLLLFYLCFTVLHFSDEYVSFNAGHAHTHKSETNFSLGEGEDKGDG